MESYVENNNNDFIILCKIQQIVDKLNANLIETKTDILHIETHANPNVIIKAVQTIRRKRNQIIIEYLEDNELREISFKSLFHIKKINNLDICL